MRTPFELNQEQLLEIAETLRDKIVEGLKAPDQEIHCIPTYVPTIDIPKNGRALVMDFGGTNIRVAVVSLKEGELIIEQGPIKKAIPVKRGVPSERRKFLDSLADLVVSLDPPANLPLGYCFSYPTESTPDGDARLIKWTKDVFVEDTINKKVGRMLIEHLANYTHPVRFSKVTVINDTVASLLAAPVTSDADGYIGLIVGTGNNMATFLEPEMIPKLPKDLDWNEPIPINFESGNFKPPHLNEWDGMLDANSENSGYQRLEKAVSGIYLARLLNVTLPESTIDPKSGSKGVVEMAYHAPDSDSKESKLAQQILERSSKLVAATLAGLIRLLNVSRSRRTICIAAEGGLFWGHPTYKKVTRTTLETLLKALGLGHITVQFIPIQNANLLGSAVAALSKRHFNE